MSGCTVCMVSDVVHTVPHERKERISSLTHVNVTFLLILWNPKRILRHELVMSQKLQLGSWFKYLKHWIVHSSLLSTHLNYRMTREECFHVFKIHNSEVNFAMTKSLKRKNNGRARGGSKQEYGNKPIKEVIVYGKEPSYPYVHQV